MRMFFAWLATVVLGLAGPDAVKLEALKKQFPQHTAGPMTESTHPKVALLYFEFKYHVSRINQEAAEQQFEALREELRAALSSIELDKLADRRAAQADQTARQQNEAWLKTRVRPWLMKLEALIVAP